MENFLPLIERNRELTQIHQLLQQYPHLILKGPRGSGKSTLVREYIERYGDHYDELYLFMSFQMDALHDLRDKSWDKTDQRPSLVVIDGFDEVFLKEDKERLFGVFKEYRKYGVQILLTASGDRPDLAPFQAQAAEMMLGRLTYIEISELVSQVITAYKLTDTEAVQLTKAAKSLDGYPVSLQQLFAYFSYRHQEGRSIQDLLNTKLHYAPIIERSELITDIRVIDDFLWKKIKKDPALLYKVHPRKFEEIVADMFSKMGYEVTLTPQTRDGGKDMYLLQHNSMGKWLYLVECKRYAADKPVSVGVVSQLYGRINHERATAGMIVTTSSFSKPAQAFQQTAEYQISLIDYANLCGLIQQMK